MKGSRGGPRRKVTWVTKVQQTESMIIFSLQLKNTLWWGQSGSKAVGYLPCFLLTQDRCGFDPQHPISPEPAGSDF